MANPWAQLSSQQPDPNDPLAQIMAQGQGGSSPADIGASTPETNAMAAEQNPMPGTGMPPQEAAPPSGAGSIFHSVNRNKLPPESTFDKQIPELLKASKEFDNKSLAAQQQGLQAYGEQLKRAQNIKTGVNLTPLLALADAWSDGKTHYAQNYQAPMSQQDKDMLSAKLQDEFLKRTQDFTKDQRDAFKDRLMAQLGIAKLSKDTSDAKQMKMDQANAGFLQKGQSSLNADKGYVKANGTMDEVNSVGQQLDAALQNPVAAAATPIALARMMTGGQRLNEVEINALGGSPGILNRLQQIAQTMQNGTLTPQNHKFMLDLAGTLKKSAEENAIEIEHRHAKQYAKMTGAPVDEAYMQLTGKTPEEVEANQARAWIKANPKADPRQVTAIKAHYGF